MTATDTAYLADPAEPLPAEHLPASSPMAALRDKIARARAARYLDLDIPGVDGVFVRFGPLDGETVARIWSGDRPVMDKHAGTVADACRGIFARQSDGTAVSVHPDHDGRITADGRLVGEPVRFYTDLADAIDGEPTRVVEVVRGLYVCDGDVKQASDAVIELSGFGRTDGSALAGAGGGGEARGR